MNKNKKSLGVVTRAKKTFLGRVLCRVLGEETGAVMMEYVVVAVLIAAAVATGAWFFGKDIMNMFGVGARAATGDITEARQLQDAARAESKRGHNQATTQDKKFIDVKEAATAGTTDNL